MKLQLSLAAIALQSLTFVSALPKHSIRDALATNVTLPDSVPKRLTEDSKPSDPAATIKKVRYGPYSMGAGKTFNGNLRNLEKPCEDCYITAFQGGLEFEDGSTANIDSGNWLHHMVWSNTGPGKKDAVCGRKATPTLWYGERFFASGNERTPVYLNEKEKFGYQVDKGDSFIAVVELMNESDKDSKVWLTITYEFVPKDTPEYKRAMMIEIDITECGASHVPAKEGKYRYTSPVWESPYSGLILWSDGHSHDGGTHTNLIINEKMACEATQFYGTSAGWIEPKSADGMNMEHISDTSVCRNHMRLEKGDKVMTEGLYDSGKHMQMLHNGRLEPQMAITFFYIGRDNWDDRISTDSNGVRMPPETSLFGGGAAATGSEHGHGDEEEETDSHDDAAPAPSASAPATPKAPAWPVAFPTAAAAPKSPKTGKQSGKQSGKQTGKQTGKQSGQQDGGFQWGDGNPDTWWVKK